MQFNSSAEDYNNPRCSDVIFLIEGKHIIVSTNFKIGRKFILIEADTCFCVLSVFDLFPLSGKRFYAHRERLLAASDAFQAICGAGYRVYVSFTL